MGYNTFCFSENTCQESLIQIISPTDSLSIIYEVYTATYNFSNDWSYRIYPLSYIFPASTQTQHHFVHCSRTENDPNSTCAKRPIIKAWFTYAKR